MPTELADNATHEDIEKFVDDVVKEREVDEPEKADSQKVAEEHDETPIAEVKTGDEDTAETGEETGTEDWLTDDLKAEVAAYGIDESELSDFTSREELERALRIFDKTALEAGRKAMAEEGAETPPRDEKTGRFTKAESKEETKSTDGYEVKLPNRELYDEDLAKDLVEEFTNLRDHYESRLEALESHFAEAAARAEEERFDGIVDTLDHADLFGKTGNETKKQLERREDLLIAVKAQQLGLQQLGRPVDLDQSLVNRVARMVFAEDIGKKELKAKTRKVAEQSNGRGGGGVGKPQDAPESIHEWAERRYKELEGH